MHWQYRQTTAHELGVFEVLRSMIRHPKIESSRTETLHRRLLHCNLIIPTCIYCLIHCVSAAAEKLFLTTPPFAFKGTDE